MQIFQNYYFCTKISQYSSLSLCTRIIPRCYRIKLGRWTKIDFEYTRDSLNSEECKSHYSSSNKTREPRSLHRSFPLIILSFSLKKPNPEYKVSQTKVLVFPKLSFLYHLCALNKIIRNHHDPTAGRFNFESKECKLEKNIDFAAKVQQWHPFSRTVGEHVTIVVSKQQETHSTIG